jgi:hypothetical protein
MALQTGQRTITFDEVYTAWTSFHSYEPEWMERLGTNFYTFKGGELYIHDENDSRTVFYNKGHGCSITYSSNKNPSDVKVFKTIGLETNSDSWFATLSSEQEFGIIGGAGNLLFENKEGFKYAHIRRDSSNSLDFNKLSILGIGELQALPGTNQYEFTNQVPNQVNVNNADSIGGDVLYFNDGTTKQIGVIDSFTANTITTVSSIFTPSVNDFCFVVKNAESESYGLRGYHATITLNNNSTSFVELYGANAEVFKSYM